MAWHGSLHRQGLLDRIFKTLFSTEVDNGNSSTAKTIDWGAGNKQKITLTGNCVFTFTDPGGAASLLLRVVQDGVGSRTATWPATVKWPGGVAIGLSAGVGDIDLIAFYYDGDGNYNAEGSLDYS